MKQLITILLFLPLAGKSQTLGGDAAYSFMRLAASPQLSALGGVNISNYITDPGLAFNNPSLLRKSMHAQASFSFNNFYADINALHAAGAFHHERLKTDFMLGLQYLSYGEVPATDAAGNELGSFRAGDWYMQISASRSYLEKWRYGMAIKFIHSNYGQYRSSAIAVDAGINYYDSSSGISISVLAKNMGTQLTRYSGAGPEDLPFDLQAGISKRLKHAPFSFSVTAQRLNRFNILYDDGQFNSENPVQAINGNGIDGVFRHFVFAAQAYLSKYVELTFGYNHLRRKELNIGTEGNGLNGFSIGAGLILNKLQVRYARSHYQNNTGYNQFGINLKLDEMFGIGGWKGVAGG